MRILIIAGNNDQAKQCARSYGLQYHEWSYVYGAEALHGMRGHPVWLVGTYDDRKDWPRLRQIIIAYELQAQFHFITKPRKPKQVRLQKLVTHDCGHQNHWLCHFCHGCGLILERGRDYDAKRK